MFPPLWPNELPATTILPSAWIATSGGKSSPPMFGGDLPPDAERGIEAAVGAEALHAEIPEVRG